MGTGRGHGSLLPPKPTQGISIHPTPWLGPHWFLQDGSWALGAATTWFLRRWLWVLQGFVVCPLMLSTKRTVSRDPATSTQLRGGTAMEKGRVLQWFKDRTTPMSRQVAVLQGQAEGGEGIQSRRVLAGEA